MIINNENPTNESDDRNHQPTKKELHQKIKELQSQLEVSQSRLQETEEFYSDRLNNLNDVLFAVDIDGYFTYINPAIKNITGYGVEEVLGTHFTKHVHPDDIPGLLEDIEKTVGGEHKPYMFRIVKKDGKISYVHTTSQPIFKNGEFIGINGLMVDIARLKHVEFKLKKERDRAQKYLDIAGVIILVTDREGKIKLMNKKGCELFNCKEQDIISKNWFDISYPENTRNKMKTNYAKHMEGKAELRPYFEESLLIKKEDRIFGWHNILLEDEDGNIKGVLSSGNDITEQKHAEKALLLAKLISDNATRTKSEFLAIISHELRTPLNAILGYSDLLYEDHFGATNNQQKQYLEIIKRSGNRLLLLINSMIELSAAEEGKIELNIKKFSVPVIIKDIMNSTIPMAKNKNINIEFEVDDNIKTMHADKNKMKVIFYNLISNAIKFTPECGDIKISITQNEGMLNVSVKDNGIGIEKNDIGKLFKPFSQLDSTLTRRFEGVGLGLMIVKEFVKMHGGKIDVESEINKGSNFIFMIPMNPEQQSDTF
jgi:PAS domain S-box-containing protein